jgi:hypothetical protein
LLIVLSESGSRAKHTNLELPWLASYMTGSGEDGREGVYPIELIVGDHHEEGEDGFPDCKNVMIGRLPFKGGGSSHGPL